MIIKNENDIYIYFETIAQLEPQKVLDVGMFLKRAGSVSRKIMNREIPKDIWLEGIDFFPETDFPVWENIYNHIMNATCFFDEVLCNIRQQKELSKEYDLAVALGTKGLYTQTIFSGMRNNLPECARYLLTDHIVDEWKVVRTVNLQVEKNGYFLLDFGV